MRSIIHHFFNTNAVSSENATLTHNGFLQTFVSKIFNYQLSKYDRRDK
ncbi:MAG: hypothetical protein M5U17_14510 [Ignavibacterium sp.]|nr:hypothetical protein [Ignavibacterium sp.]